MNKNKRSKTPKNDELAQRQHISHDPINIWRAKHPIDDRCTDYDADGF